MILKKLEKIGEDKLKRLTANEKCQNFGGWEKGGEV